MEQTSLIAFAFAALLLNLSPGPSLFFVSARGMSEGKAAGAVSALGLASGSSIHALLAGVGVTVGIFSIWDGGRLRLHVMQVKIMVHRQRQRLKIAC